MGQQDSKIADVEAASAQDFVGMCNDAHKNDDVDSFKKLWAPFVDRKNQDERKDSFRKYDNDLVSMSILDPNADAEPGVVGVAFRSHKLEWRREGIMAARCLFYIDKARKQLVKADFIDSVLLITLPEVQKHRQEDVQEVSIAEQMKETREQEELQLLAAETFKEMASYPDFLEALCTTSVLNFLCIVLNQVARSQEIVTHTFVKLSDDKNRLVVLMEGAMGDILETFFKTVDFVKPFNPEDKQALLQWRTGTIALSNTAQALSSLIKYDHPCMVDMPTIVKVFHYSLAIMKLDDEPRIDITDSAHLPDNVQLLAHIAKLFYWKTMRTANTSDLIKESAPRALNLDGDGKLNFVLKVLVAMWKRCVATQNILEDKEKGPAALGANDKEPKDIIKINQAFDKFCVDDLDRSKSLDLSQPKDKLAFEAKKRHADMRLCYLNCTLWLLLPMSNLRWKLRDFGLKEMHLAFKLRDEAYLMTILGTVRYLVDLPAAQESHEFIMFFGEQLLILLDLTLDQTIKSQEVIKVLLDTISILAMAREMQEMLAKLNIHEKLKTLRGLQREDASAEFLTKIELATLRTLAEVSIHPSHRLPWVDNKGQSDGQCDFKTYIKDESEDGFRYMLERKLKQDNEDNFKTISSLLLTILKEEKFKREASDIEGMFRAVGDWWQGNSTARFEDGKSVGMEGNQSVVRKPKTNLQEMLRQAIWKQEMNQAITVMESEKFCAPHECVIVLSLFSRLALEPKFKSLFVKHEILDPLLGCICVGIWAEAREAAATLANLMWVPDLTEERLVCWLKLDGPRCVTVDAANVLMPIKTGNPKQVDIGKGMYKAAWGVEFVEGAGVTLHPQGLKTHQVPGILTTASPGDKFNNTSQKPYEWFAEDRPQEREFTITCWFYWPLPKADALNGKRVLVHSTPEGDGQSIGKPLIYVDAQYDDKEKQTIYRWTLMGQDLKEDPPSGQWKAKRLRTPELNPGWHMVSVLSSTEENSESPFRTKLFLDEWSCTVEGIDIPNDFYTVGNSPNHKQPFGLITDFRIYARVLKEEEVKMMVRSRDTEQHPDRLVRMLAQKNAATILAQRLDVPDSAAECLRALGSLASLNTQRAKIFSVCGRRVLQMIDSPLPMIQRQAARLINNIT